MARASEPKLFEHTGEAFSIVVRSDETQLTGFLDVVVQGPDGPTPAVDELLKILQGAKVKFCPDLAERLAKALAAGPEVRGLVVAEGKSPQMGAPGRVDWKVNIAADAKRAVKVVEGRADYHEVREIAQVEEGAELLTLVPPETGAAGEDIFGRVIPGVAGEPAWVQCGHNVRFDTKSGTAFAEVAGAVEFGGDRLAVVAAHTVEGDVAAETGNINFAGEVFIKGDVHDDYSVHSKKNITVLGSVHAARLETDGDIRIALGASGHGKGALAAGGNIHAKYLNAMDVVCRGDLNVGGEVVNCTVRVGGRLAIPLGRIIGGDVVARRALEARQLGSPSNIPTRVTVGIDVDTVEKIAGLKARLLQVTKDSDRIYHLVKMHIDDPATLQDLPERKRSAVQANIDTFAGLRQQKQDFEALLRELEGEEIDPQEQVVKVLKTIHGKVTITIGTCSETFTREVPGPVTFFADPTTGSLRRW